MMIRFMWPLIQLRPYPFVSIPLLVGNLNFESAASGMPFSQRYGYMPLWHVGPVRITWVRYRRLGEPPRRWKHWRGETPDGL